MYNVVVVLTICSLSILVSFKWIFLSMVLGIQLSTYFNKGWRESSRKKASRHTGFIFRDILLDFKSNKRYDRTYGSVVKWHPHTIIFREILLQCVKSVCTLMHRNPRTLRLGHYIDTSFSFIAFMEFDDVTLKRND